MKGPEQRRAGDGFQLRLTPSVRRLLAAELSGIYLPLLGEGVWFLEICRRTPCMLWSFRRGSKMEP
jgi:hypothetical protein